MSDLSVHVWRLCRAAEPTLDAEVAGGLDRARDTGATEDRAHGTDRSADEAGLEADKQRRLETIQTTKAALGRFSSTKAHGIDAKLDGVIATKRGEIGRGVHH